MNLTLKSPVVHALYKIVSLIIVFEILFTGLGFCGHFPEDSQQAMILLEFDHHLHLDSDGNHLEAHRHQPDCPDCQTGSGGKFHCNCSGGFIATIGHFAVFVPLNVQEFSAYPQTAYCCSWQPEIDHPPILSA